MTEGSTGCSTSIDEFTHECLAIRVARKLKAVDVIDVLSGSLHPARRAGAYPF